ncbi:MAG TPA: hypothetical protein VHJ78_12385 [Actinomycetota bacterium]|nr:hypothetical protein [Actinomycetota bacterium]
MIARSTQFNRRPAAGLAVALAYLLVAWASVEAGLVSRSPLYDGLADIPAYRWVNPPPERQGDNEVPRAEEFQVEVSTSGQADPGSVTTSDGQATLTFNYLPPSPEPYFLTLKMTPLDPAELAPPPGGFYFDGNAYRMETLDDRTKAPVEGSFTAIMRFSVHAPHILALDGDVWTPVPDPLMTDADLQVSADLPANGTFVPAGTGTRPPEQLRSEEPFPWFSTIIGTLGLLLLMTAGVVAFRRRNAD